jgi:hypothetical protein
MGTSEQRDRAAETDAEVRKFLAAGNTRGALHAARHALEAEAAERRRKDPAAAALLEAMAAGSIAAMAAGWATVQPLRPPGYAGGLPAAAHLAAAYQAARAQTERQRQPEGRSS